MMICEKCGGNKFSVVDKRDRTTNEYIYRRRKCLSCGYKFNSVEISQSKYEEYIAHSFSRTIDEVKREGAEELVDFINIYLMSKALRSFARNTKEKLQERGQI